MPEKSGPLKDFDILSEVKKLEKVKNFQGENNDIDPEQEAREVEVAYSYHSNQEIPPIRKVDQLRESLTDMGRSLRYPSTYIRLAAVYLAAQNAEFFLSNDSLFSGIVAGMLWTVGEITYSRGGKPENPLNK